MKVFLTIAVGPSAGEATPLCASTNHAVVTAALNAILGIGSLDGSPKPTRTPPSPTSRQRPLARAA